MSDSMQASDTEIKAKNTPEEFAETTMAAERIAVATQWQLMWWRFKKHKLATFSAVIVMVFYLIVIFADFLAYAPPFETEAEQSFIPPSRFIGLMKDAFIRMC